MPDVDRSLTRLRWVLSVATVLVVAAIGAVSLLAEHPRHAVRPQAVRASFQGESVPAPPATPELDRPVPSALLSPPPAGTELESPFVETARRVIPAVVSVEVIRTIEHPPLEGESNDLFRRLIPGHGNGDNQIEVPSSGSGFLIDPEGYILTNDHVASGAEKIRVHLADGRLFDAVLLGTDPGTDVAVLKIEPRDGDDALPILALGDSDAIRVGDWAIAVGNPLGELESTLTIGVVSATGRRNLRIAGGGPTYQDFVQTDASINFGNSGGPLVNVRGEVWGINSAVNPDGQGLGFAIPINMAREVAVELIRSGTVRRGYLGIYPETLSAEYKEAHDVDAALEGILVATVQDDSPAQRGGLEPGDVIVRFDDDAITDVTDFRKRVADAGVGTRVDLRVVRGGKERDLAVVLELRPDTLEPPTDWTPPTEEEWLGLGVEDIGAEHVERYHLNRVRGVVLTRIDMGRSAEKAGLRAGDVIVRVGDRPVEDTEAFHEALIAALDDDGTADLEVLRGENHMTAELRLER